MPFYSEKVIEHFRNPRNYGRMEKPDGVGKVGNVVCGDIMELYIKVEKDVIRDARFQTFGCAAALATSSVITDLARGKSLERALNIGNKDVVKTLGGLPPIKIHCSLLAVDALKEAIYDYLRKNRKPVPKELEKHHKKLVEDMQRIEERYGHLKDVKEPV
jgi:nitrogen fixation NifU-like protein